MVSPPEIATLILKDLVWLAKIQKASHQLLTLQLLLYFVDTSNIFIDWMEAFSCSPDILTIR